LEQVMARTLKDGSEVPRLETSRLPDDYLEIDDVDRRKRMFLGMLLPLALLENERIAQQRTTLIRTLADFDRAGHLGDERAAWLKDLAREYRVKADPLRKPEARERLLRRVDVVPVSLTLAQAATESAWGRSRFAREANNLFGIWTYDESEGIVPKRRAAGKKHLIRKFDTFRDSVAYYLHTLNTHPAYAKLRGIRAGLRQAEREPTGTELAEGLEKYSGIGKKYVGIVQTIIETNALAQLEDARLARG
jgi:Bax protein